MAIFEIIRKLEKEKEQIFLNYITEHSKNPKFNPFQITETIKAQEGDSGLITIYSTFKAPTANLKEYLKTKIGQNNSTYTMLHHNDYITGDNHTIEQIIQEILDEPLSNRKTFLLKLKTIPNVKTNTKLENNLKNFIIYPEKTSDTFNLIPTY